MWKQQTWKKHNIRVKLVTTAKRFSLGLEFASLLGRMCGIVSGYEVICGNVATIVCCLTTIVCSLATIMVAGRC